MCHQPSDMKKIQAAVILTAATVTLALDNVASAGEFECEAEHQCDSGYCYLETGKCVPCADCASYLREPSQWRTCVRGPEDCGECLTGFEHEYLFDGTTRNFCVPKKEIEIGILNERSPYFWLIIASSLGLIVVLICVVLSVYRGVKRTWVHNSNPDAEDPPPLNTDNGSNEPPPSYDSCIPLLGQSGVSSALVTSLTVVEKVGNTLQQAVPFTNPSPPYGIGQARELENEVQDLVPEDFDLPINPLMDEADENEEPRAISPPQLEDEDTMPSNWTPFREPALASEEPSVEEDSSATSSLSHISITDPADMASNAQEILNDSGVSASCSHQSNLSSSHGEEQLEVLTHGQDGAASGIITVLQRRRSDEDLSTLSDRKRQRRDSGSSSMISVETYREIV